MATRQITEVMRRLRSAVLRAEALTDAQLLERFLSRRDAAALEVLVRRHASMVWGISRRLLRDHHDAEDAFQATFLVLVRRAASVRPRELVGNWLYGVAYQTARKARASRAKRRVREARQTTMPEPTVTDPEPRGDLQSLLDQELSRLPEIYRAIIVLCDLEGKSRKEAARQLRLPEGTVGSRLARGRALLARRLGRHGLAVSGGVLSGVLAREASAAVPGSVLCSTINAVTAVAVGQAAAGVVSGAAAALTEGVIKAMYVKKLLSVSAVLLAAALVAGSGGLLYRTQAAEPGGSGSQPAGTPPSQMKPGEKRADIEAARAQLLQARADVELAQARLAEAKARLSRLTQELEAVRQTVVPMQQFTGRLDRLGDPKGESILVVFDMDERSYLRYQRLLREGKVKGPGSPLYLGLVDEQDFPHQGKFTGFGYEVNPTTGTVKAHGILPNPDRQLLPGMFVRVRIPFGSDPSEAPTAAPAPRAPDNSRKKVRVYQIDCKLVTANPTDKTQNKKAEGKIVVEPRVVVIEGKEASFLDGGEIAIPVPGQDRQKVAFMPFGHEVRMKVESSKQGYVLLDTYMQFSRIEQSGKGEVLARGSHVHSISEVPLNRETKVVLDRNASRWAILKVQEVGDEVRQGHGNAAAKD